MMYMTPFTTSLELPSMTQTSARKTLRIATRKSPLAMCQALHIHARLEAMPESFSVEILGMTARGAKIPDTPVAKVRCKGLF